MSNIQVKFYEKREDFPYRFSVICAWHQGELLLVRHRARDTWEIPGGHIEPGETPVVAARRELCEETGAQAFAVIPVCAYSVSRDGGEESFGMLYCGEVRALGDLPESEIVEVRHFPALPEVEALTYPEIQPLLYEKALMQRQPIPALEPMADFFTARVEGYDEHMLEDVEGCREGVPGDGGLYSRRNPAALGSWLRHGS